MVQCKDNQTSQWRKEKVQKQTHMLSARSLIYFFKKVTLHNRVQKIIFNKHYLKIGYSYKENVQIDPCFTLHMRRSVPGGIVDINVKGKTVKLLGSSIGY